MYTLHIYVYIKYALYIKKIHTLLFNHIVIVNNDNVRMPTVMLCKLYLLNVLSSDYCSVLKLQWKF